MANSDNVLRAGLTPKHIDVEELIANTKFTSTSLSELKLLPLNNNGRMEFPIPVEDFRFEIIKNHVGHIKVNSPEILLCIDGMIEVVCNEKKETLDCGGSLFISGGTDEYKIKCNGILARVYV